MNYENIIFEKDDTLKETLTKIVYIHVGTNRLKIELDKKGIKYVKVDRGAKVIYILRGKGIDNKLEIQL